jgi:two-component system, NarL family, sensor histidine kinase BarA
LKAFLGQRISFKFLIATSLTIAVIFVVVFVWFSRQQEDHIMEQVKKQAIILHKQIVLTRHWVADQNGVLVPKTPEISSNHFLNQPDVQGSDGIVYTRISPSVITRLLSERALKSGLYSFKLTNTERLNKENAPDEFELKALRLFRSGAQDETFTTERVNGKSVLRYVAPLYVNETCAKCHTSQSYKPGDVGGCLSVFIPMDEARSAINRNRVTLLGGGVLLAGSLVVLVFVSARSLVFKRLDEIRAAMSRMTVSKQADSGRGHGDELKEIADFCYVLDEKMKNQHQELERKIAEATRDLSATNKSLESANLELEQLNQAKSDFFSDISHELRTPLTNIKGAADFLERKASCVDPIYVDIIKRNTDHLIKVVVDFLDYSKIESGRLELDLEQASLKDVAEDAILSQQAVAQTRSVQLVLEAPGDFLLVFDKQRIYQVLTNLLSNAVRFSPPGGTVRVRISGPNLGAVAVTVQDSGPGIEDKYHESIFKKFYQIGGQRDPKIHKGSSGIGLAICKGLIEAHHGQIWVQSRLGEGSSFSFSLPKGNISVPK